MRLICPICGRRLDGGHDESGGRVTYPPIRCENGHSFDVSAKGSVNLLRSGGGHGDSAEMLAARRRFLSGGYYIPLADALLGAIKDFCPHPTAILDAGCGEGWYISRLDRELGSVADIAAVDVSPKAAALTAGLFPREERMKRVFCAAASVNALPLEDGSVDVLLSVFSPLAPDEFARTVKGGGIVIRAVPTARHLWQLKAAVYERPYENDESVRDIPGFDRISERRVEYTVNIEDKGDLEALFSMTPYSRTTGAEDEKKLLMLGSLETGIGFIVTVYRRRN